MLVKWEQYTTIDEFIDDMRTVEEIYCRYAREYDEQRACFRYASRTDQTVEGRDFVMIILTKENIVSYIREHVPSITLEEPVQVNVIGEGDLSEMWKATDTVISFSVWRTRIFLHREAVHQPSAPERAADHAEAEPL